MNIDKHIENLLYRYNCLIIPDFGGLLTQMISARFNPVSYEFFPPSKKLRFNAQLKTNDGLLVHHIKQIEGISFEQAELSVQRIVRSWKNELERGQNVCLKNIGDFSLNNEGNIVFYPDNKINYAKTSFGLAPVKAHYIMSEEKPFDINTGAFSWKKVSVAAIVCLFFVGAIGYVNKDKMKYQLADMIGTADKQDTNFTHFYSHRPSIYPKPYQTDIVFQKALTRQIRKEKQSINIEKQQADIARKKPKQYQLVAGAFKYKANAFKKLKQLKAQGFEKATIIGFFNGLRLVSYNTFEDKQQAKKAFYLLKSQGKEVWLRKSKGAS